MDYVLGAGKELCLDGRSLSVTLGSLAITVIKWVRSRNSVKVVHAFRGASSLHCINTAGCRASVIPPELLRAE